MITMIACLIALVSTSAFLALWFWVVRRELYGKQKTVDAAKCQLTASRQQYVRVGDDPKVEQVHKILERSQSVYRQSVRLYNEALHKPWNTAPAFFLGFRQKSEEDKTEQNK